MSNTTKFHGIGRGEKRTGGGNRVWPKRLTFGWWPK